MSHLIFLSYGPGITSMQHTNYRYFAHNCCTIFLSLSFSSHYPYWYVTANHN